MKKSRLIIMDIIIVILVVLNAAMIIAVAENYNDENRTYNTRWFMNLYKNDEYGRAVDYASRDKIVIDNIQDNELDESIAVAEYYNAEFYKNVYKTMGNTQKLKQMELNIGILWMLLFDNYTKAKLNKMFFIFSVV